MNGGGPRRTIVFLLFLIIIAAGAWLRISRLSDPFDGYHSMNEAWYSAQARNFSTSSLWNPTVGHGIVDYKVRPLYAMLSWSAIKLIGDTVAAPRAVSVVFSLVSLLWIYLIGCALANRAVGLLAAAFLAACPVYTVVGRQAQPDAAYVSLALAAAWLFFYSQGRRNEILLKFISGVVWGLSVFTKNFGLLLLPGLVAGMLIERRPLKKIFRDFIPFLIPAAAIPIPFIIYHHTRHPGMIGSIYAGAALRFPGSGDLKYMLKEMFWAVSPVIFIAGIIGIASAIISKRRGGWWTAALAAPFAIQYFFMHVHSYYILGLVPFLALGAALFFKDAAFSRKLSPVIAVILIFSFAQSALSLGSLKWGRSRFKEACDFMSVAGPRVAIVASPDVYNNYRPIFYYYLPNAAVFIKDKDVMGPRGLAGLPKDTHVFLIDFGQEKPEQVNPFVHVYGYELYGFHIFGREFFMLPTNRHSFIPAGIRAVPSNKGGAGFSVAAYIPSVVLTEVPTGYKLKYDGKIWTIIKSEPE